MSSQAFDDPGRWGSGGAHDETRFSLVDADRVVVSSSRFGSPEAAPKPVAVDALLESTRRGLDRVAAADLATEMADGALVVDTRPVEQRRRDGTLPGAVVIDRDVLEWRLDPTSPDRIPQVTNATQRIVLVCHEGYSSSLAAATLRQLGLLRATDLIGGFQAWRELLGSIND